MNNRELLEDLYEAIEEDNLKRVEYLISKGVNLNKRKNNNVSAPLYFAIQHNKSSISIKVFEHLFNSTPFIFDDEYLNLLTMIGKYSKNGSLKDVFTYVSNHIERSIKIDIYRKFILVENDLDPKVLDFIKTKMNELLIGN